MKTRFSLTFQVVTEASASNGDFARHGFITRHGELPATKSYSYIPKRPATFDLREAINLFKGFDDGSGPAEADSSHLSASNPPRWFNTCNQHFDEYGENINVSLHIPKTVTPSSAMRLARYLRCYGVK